MKQKNLIACDVCNTLYNSNTTFDFISYLVSQERKRNFLMFQLISRKYSPFFYLLLFVGKLINTDVVRQLALQFLSGKSMSDLNSQALQFYDLILKKKRNEKVFSLLENRRNDGEILLLSSSIDPVVKAIADRNGFQYKSSELEYKNGFATGRLIRDITGRKHLLLNRILSKEGFNKLLAITDNQSDFEMVKMADEKFVIIQSPKDKAFWRDLAPTFVLW